MDPNPLITLFRQCVAQVCDGTGKFRGTGFFAAPGQLVTCAHVAYGASELRVRWQEQEAVVGQVTAVPPMNEVSDPAAYPLPDLAVLTVEDAGEWGHPCVALAEGQPALVGTVTDLYLSGYTVEHGHAPALTGVKTEFESLITEDFHEFFELKGGLVLPGFSGSPLLDLLARAVVGIVESSRSQRVDLARVSPLV